MKVRLLMLAAAISATMMSPRVDAGDPLPMDEQLHHVISGTCMLSLVDQKLMDGADPNYKNKDSSLGVKVGDNALIAALRRPCAEKVIKRMVTGKVPVNINTMHVKKANIETPGVDGLTPLVLAVMLDDVSIVKMILEAGADPDKAIVSPGNAQTNGKKAIDFAKGKHEKKIKKLLKKN
jgi:ankyrin repeat protein